MLSSFPAFLIFPFWSYTPFTNLTPPRPNLTISPAPDLAAGWGNSIRGCWDGPPHPGHHPGGIPGQHGPHHRSQTEYCRPLWQDTGSGGGQGVWCRLRGVLQILGVGGRMGAGCVKGCRGCLEVWVKCVGLRSEVLQWFGVSVKCVALCWEHREGGCVCYVKGRWGCLEMWVKCVGLCSEVLQQHGKSMKYLALCYELLRA